MKTQLFTNTPENIIKTAEILKKGGLAAIPTETVYGLAADALNGEAVAKIFAAKGRPMDNPLIVHVAEFEDIERFALVREIPEAAKKLAKVFWPGPLTIIMKKGGVIPDEVSAGLDTVAIRLPSHPSARAIIKAADTPLAAPSANLSVLLKCTDDEFTDYVNRCGGSGVAALCCDEDVEKLCVKYISLGKRNDYEAHAQRLFDSLRRIDGYGNIVTVYTRLPSTDGVGLAVYNRLIRAAGFEVIDLEKS